MLNTLVSEKSAKTGFMSPSNKTFSVYRREGGGEMEGGEEGRV